MEKENRKRDYFVMIESPLLKILIQPAVLHREHAPSEYNNSDNNNKTESRTHTKRSKFKVYSTTALPLW